MTVPHNTKKSVLDAWNGYHSIEIREQDRHMTTFLTGRCRYRYKSAPQGYMASGDAYTHRYDKITVGVQNVRRVIDDTLLYGKDLEEAYKQVASYLTLVGNNGIILNSDKFSFGEDVVDWAGIRLTKDKVEPLPDHVRAIREGGPNPCQHYGHAQLLGISEPSVPILQCECTPPALQRVA